VTSGSSASSPATGRSPLSNAGCWPLVTWNRQVRIAPPVYRSRAYTVSQVPRVKSRNWDIISSVRALTLSSTAR
jgi:hypothetical protein